MFLDTGKHQKQRTPRQLTNSTIRSRKNKSRSIRTALLPKTMALFPKQQALRGPVQVALNFLAAGELSAVKAGQLSSRGCSKFGLGLWRKGSVPI